MIDNEKYSIILPGRIVEYFKEDQTATIQISVESVVSSALDSTSPITRKPLEGVPVHTPSGGGWAITMPIKKGDTCVLFFSQVGYDHWLYQDKDIAGTLANLPKPWLGRQFDENDGYALVGLNTLPRAIQNYSGEHSQWRNEDATQVISLNDDASITIDSTVSLTINAPIVEINTPDARINGPLHCTGAITSDISISAPTVTGTASLVVAGKEMGLHKHSISGSPPI